jgi:hypothetical protein
LGTAAGALQHSYCGRYEYGGETTRHRDNVDKIEQLNQIDR